MLKITGDFQAAPVPKDACVDGCSLLCCLWWQNNWHPWSLYEGKNHPSHLAAVFGYRASYPVAAH